MKAPTFVRSAGILLILAAAILAGDVLFCVVTGHDYATEPYRPYRYFLSVPLTVALGGGMLLGGSDKVRRWLAIGFMIAAAVLLYHTAVLLWYVCHRVVPG